MVSHLWFCAVTLLYWFPHRTVSCALDQRYETQGDLNLSFLLNSLYLLQLCSKSNSERQIRTLLNHAVCSLLLPYYYHHQHFLCICVPSISEAFYIHYLYHTQQPYKVSICLLFYRWGNWSSKVGAYFLIYENIS